MARIALYYARVSNQASLGCDSQLSRGNTVGRATQFGIIRKAALYAGFGPGTVDLFRRLSGKGKLVLGSGFHLYDVFGLVAKSLKEIPPLGLERRGVGKNSDGKRERRDVSQAFECVFERSANEAIHARWVNTAFSRETR